MKKPKVPMHAVKEFRRHAASYRDYSVIQRQAAAYLLAWIGERKLGRVLDIGCGDGALYRGLCSLSLDFEAFVGVDLAEEMLALHPVTRRVRLLRGDFNDPRFLRSLRDERPQTILSASALQWSLDLDRTLGELATLGARRHYLSLFTSGTFATLHRLAGIVSPIRSFEETRVALARHYHLHRVERVRYRLHFDSTREIFRYIKRSGVSGGEARLGYRQAKRVMEAYPLDYLEFELLFASGEPRRDFSRS
jgi:malonyl-CoA O-methyltransferase